MIEEHIYDSWKRKRVKGVKFSYLLFQARKTKRQLLKNTDKEVERSRLRSFKCSRSWLIDCLKRYNLYSRNGNVLSKKFFKVNLLT